MGNYICPLVQLLASRQQVRERGFAYADSSAMIGQSINVDDGVAFS